VRLCALPRSLTATISQGSSPRSASRMDPAEPECLHRGLGWATALVSVSKRRVRSIPKERRVLTSEQVITMLRNDRSRWTEARIGMPFWSSRPISSRIWALGAILGMAWAPLALLTEPVFGDTRRLAQAVNFYRDCNTSPDKRGRTLP